MKLFHLKMKLANLKFALRIALIGAGTFAIYACLNPIGNGLDSSGNLLEPNGDLKSKDTSFFTTKVQPIFTANCIVCHSPTGTGFAATGGSSGGLDLTAGNSYASLGAGTAKTTFQLPTTAPSVRVKPGDPDGSYLYQKINSATPKSGARMPIGGVLTTDQISTIQTWIQNGAKGANP